MKRKITFLLLATLISSAAFGQEETRHHSSGPRRQLATIVFAGLGGAILGLSTLSFYGRPQDNLSNIAIGFAVGVIAGTTYVTVRSATTRDYYDEKKPDARLDLPEENHLVYGPLLTKVSPEANAYGGLIALRF